MVTKAKSYIDNGVTISKSSISEGDEIVITYSGLLAASGADTVFAHIGYGEAWDNKDYIPMIKEGDIFTAAFKVGQPGTLNICFKDSAENWDNNSNQNYSFKIKKKAVRKTVKSV
ncbi:MAG: carbohydrate-binding protein [Bacillota bacterium]|nr:carbohydrate-binding protein [Bacillota bacterium]